MINCVLDFSPIKTTVASSISVCFAVGVLHAMAFVDADKAGLDHSTLPVILWWTELLYYDEAERRCQRPDVSCLSTRLRKHQHAPNTTMAVAFYGTSFDLSDLPLPKRHQWALFHEESPKNVYLFSHPEALSLFNHSATFRRKSNFPLTALFLRSIGHLLSRKFWISTVGKNVLLRRRQVALLAYVQSDCGAPSDRDRLVRMIQRHTPVDCLGLCLHNKDMPDSIDEPMKGMEADEFFRLNGRYKFTVTLENAVCEDYVTEKLWRPLIVGSVPIVSRGNRVDDFLPSDRSAIFVEDYSNARELVDYLRYLDRNDSAYDEYLSYKHGGITNGKLLELYNLRKWGYEYPEQTMFEGFECQICQRLHRQGSLYPAVTIDHYGCPEPTRFSDHPKGNLSRISNPKLSYGGAAQWRKARKVARLLRQCVTEGRKDCSEAKLAELLFNSSKSTNFDEINQLNGAGHSNEF